MPNYNCAVALTFFCLGKAPSYSTWARIHERITKQTQASKPTFASWESQPWVTGALRKKRRSIIVDQKRSLAVTKARDCVAFPSTPSLLYSHGLGMTPPRVLSCPLNCFYFSAVYAALISRIVLHQDEENCPLMILCYKKFYFINLLLYMPTALPELSGPVLTDGKTNLFHLSEKRFYGCDGALVFKFPSRISNQLVRTDA
ncbi:hypothetical protein Y032_0002g686 [Ancylostoma ceylanicum]|uniref:Uncharacterized protein n=1 Tax=Ancylostoma ceylanicum TaxID=53326 RepID=A0A016W1T2_9BILA|nr:hypothetical protein Y032_0002g686 [Ancylostoma ceylanicum]